MRFLSLNISLCFFRTNNKTFSTQINLNLAAYHRMNLYQRKAKTVFPQIRGYTSSISTEIPESNNISRNPISEMEKRGMVQSVTSLEVHKLFLDKKNVKMYCGFDPTASSLHIGNLISIVGLLHAQRCGHGAIGLIGGATGSIGDPSGRSTERNALDKEELDKNTKAISIQLEQILERGMAYLKKNGYVYDANESSSTGSFKIVNNLSWFQDMKFIDFIGDVGRLARVSAMLSRESVKSRLENPEGISFTEFTYQLLQAYDFYQLYFTENCQIQLGGSDQWGNIVSGIDLVRRKTSLKNHIKEKPGNQATTKQYMAVPPVYGVVMPLLTDESGAKFGKSAGNAVWLDDKKLSVFDFYQYFRRTSDAQVEKLLRFFTFLPLDRIIQIMLRHENERHLQNPQKILAFEVTCLVHGESEAKKAQTKSIVLFENDMETMKAKDILDAFQNDEMLVNIVSDQVLNQPLIDVVLKSKLVSSKC